MTQTAPRMPARRTDGTQSVLPPRNRLLRRSYDSCGSATPLLGLTVDECLEQVAARYPDHEAVVSLHQGLRFTYGEFDAVVSRAAKALLALGIGKGDRVAIWSTNSYEWMTAQYATARIGAVLVNINPAYRSHELEYVLRRSRAKSLMLIESFKSSNYVDMLLEVCPEIAKAEPGHLHSWRFPELESVIFIGSKEHAGMLNRRSFVELAEELSDEVLQERRAELDIDDDINIQYTSGTTGFPKGVVLTHNNLINNAWSIAQVIGLRPDDRLCVPIPFYHCFGMVVSNLATMTVGATIVIPGPAFEPGATLRAVESERCTLLHGVPTMFVAELEHEGFGQRDLTSLRGGIMAGAPCPVDVMNAVRDRMHMKEVLIGYGQTEASPVTTLTRPDDPVELRISTVGRVLPHQELKIVEPATGRTVRRGEDGEICFRGYHVMSRYDDMPEETKEAIDVQNWLHSGDIGTMDEAGYVRITGRIKEMVIRGGENIFPREIEEFIRTLDGISDVAVVGIPDPKFGEELLAWVTFKPGAESCSAEELRERCKGRIAHFKIPRYWKVVDEFPMTVTGKIQKFRIREIATRELGLGNDATESPEARAGSS